MRLFVSYARVDKPLCKQIIELLQDVHDVWYDKRLHAGQDWWNEIQERLAWCEGFVYLLSPESVASEYCQQEYEIAAKSGKDLFPVLIQAKTDIPKSLSHLHYANLSEGMEDMITLMNALTVAERRQRNRTSFSPPQPISVSRPSEISPSVALSKAAEAMEAHHYDNAVFLLKEALQKKPEGRLARILQNMLDEAEAALEQQTYLKKAEREYAPIATLAKVSATRALACEEFADFQQYFPDYDPEKIGDLCASVGEQTPSVRAHSRAPLRNMMDILPAPFEWIEIPAGKVTLEKKSGFYGGEQTFKVEPFAIAKYPVTNAQFAEFMKAGGYSEKRWWTEAGWEARLSGWEWVVGDFKQTGKPWTEPRYWKDKKWNGGEQPVVGVSWYEVIAFCQWLSEVVGARHASPLRISLPTEIQWQWAAGGKSQLTYPWGEDWDASRCNNNVGSNTMDKTSSPVYQYEGRGDSPFGVVDMVGNVWEWCLTDYQRGENSANGDNSNGRVLRGGSSADNFAEFFRVANRDKNDPHNAVYNLGFRCARF